MRIKLPHIKSLIPFIFFFLTLLLQLFIKNNAPLTEKYYSTGLYPLIAQLLSSVSVLLPFSLGDLFYLALILTFFIGLGLLIFKKNKLWQVSAQSFSNNGYYVCTVLLALGI